MNVKATTPLNAVQPLNWQFWIPVEGGTVFVGAAIGAFMGSIYMASGIVPTVATGMMVSFSVGGLAGWLDTKRQALPMAWYSGLIMAVAVWAGALNLAIAVSLAPMAFCQAFLPDQLPPWEQICQGVGAVGGLVGGTITALVLRRQQVALGLVTLGTPGAGPVLGTPGTHAGAAGDSPSHADPPGEGVVASPMVLGQDATLGVRELGRGDGAVEEGVAGVSDRSP
jgi:hypothetical protein